MTQRWASSTTSRPPATPDQRTSMPATPPAAIGRPGRSRSWARAGEGDRAPRRVHRDAEHAGQDVDPVGEHLDRPLHVGGVAGRAHGPAPPEVVHVGVAGEQAGVDRLGDPHVAHVERHAGEDPGDELGEAGVHPAPEERRPTGLGRRRQGGDRRPAERATRQQLRRGHHVHARPQQRGRPRRRRRGAACRRRSRAPAPAGRRRTTSPRRRPAVEADQRARRRRPSFDGRPGVDAHQRQVGPAEDGPHRLPGHVARRPLDDPEGRAHDGGTHRPQATQASWAETRRAHRAAWSPVGTTPKPSASRANQAPGPRPPRRPPRTGRRPCARGPARPRWWRPSAAGRRGT